MLSYLIMTEPEIRQVCAWLCDGEYAAYYLPDYTEMQKRQMGFCNPDRRKNFYSYYNNTRLVGFTNLLEEETEVLVGTGVSPQLCNKGYGRQILALVRQIAAQLYPNKPLYLEVRCWNRRAIACYQRAGFCIEGESFEQTTPMGKGSFYRLRMGICRQFVTNFSISFRSFSMGNVKRFSFLRLQTISKSSIINHKGGE